MNHHLLSRIVALVTFFCWQFPAHAAGEEPLRVVPQTGWAKMGIASPDGAFFATATTPYGTHLIKLVSKHGELLWSIPLSPPMDFSFSPDGKWLAACGENEGLLVNLQSCELRYHPAWCGKLLAFTPDSQKVLIVRRRTPGLPPGKRATDQGLFVYDLNAQQSAHFQVDMDVPIRLEVLPDGKTVRISGAHGRTGMIIPSPMGKAVETSHLDTGKMERDWSPATKDWKWDGLHDNSRYCELPPENGRIRLFPQPKGFLWSEASGICVQYGSGSPKGNVIVWDIRNARHLRYLDEGIDPLTVTGFIGSDQILASVWSGRESQVSLVNVRTGRVSSTAIPKGPMYAPSPDGKCCAVIDAGRNPNVGKSTTRHLDLYRLPQNEPFFADDGLPKYITPIVWSRDGSYLAYLRGGTDHAAVRIVCAANEKSENLSLAGLIEKYSTARPKAEIRVKTLDIDDSGQLLAVGSGETDSGLAAVLDRKTGSLETVLDDFPIWVAAVRFIGNDRLLTGTYRGTVQLWDLHRQKPLWTTETGRETIQFAYNPNGPYVVCAHRGQSGTVLQLENGKVQYRTSRLWSGGNRVPDNWIQPCLIGGGTFSLEMNSESMQVRLVDLATGLTVLAFCALPEGQWVIYTPDGDWDGSERVHEWVKFCRGLAPVSRAEADRRHRRDRIEAVLKRAIANKPANP